MRSIQPGRSNAFDHLRLLAAFAVLFQHHYGLTLTSAAWPFLNGVGNTGVELFFAISGYLNAKSLLKSNSVSIFLVHRALRIYPGLIGCMGFTVVLGSCISTLSFTDYWNHETFAYFWKNSGVFFGQLGFLPGVFENNPINVVNASIWTLPVEARYYLYLAMALLLFRFRPAAILAAFILLCAYVIFARIDVSQENNLERLGSVFIAGVAIAGIETLWGRWRAIVIVMLAAIVIVLTGLKSSAASIFLTVATVSVGSLSVGERYRMPMDISYGFYLYAFPLQQFAVGLGLSFYASFAIALIATVVAATASAALLEQPALKLARHLTPLITARFANTRSTMRRVLADNSPFPAHQRSSSIRGD